MSQDGRDTSDKASPERQDAPAADGDSKKKAAADTAGKTSTDGSSSAAPKRVQPTAAGPSGATTAPATDGTEGAGKSAAEASAARRETTSPTPAAATDTSKGTSKDASKDAPEKPAAAAKTASGGSAAQAKTAAHRAPRKKKESGGGLSTVLWTLLVVAVGGGVAIATLPRWQPAWNENVGAQFPALRITLGDGGGSELDTRLADVESRLGDIAALDQRSQELAGELDRAIARINELESGIREVRQVAEQVAEQPAQSDASEALQSINKRLEALEGRAVSEGELDQSMSRVQGRLSELEQQTADARAELRNRLDALAERTADVRTAAQDDSQALVLAVAQLRDSVRRGLPYAEDLETLRTISDDGELAQPIAQLEGHAATGIPTLTTLAQRFEAIAGGLVTAARATDDAPWWQRAMDEVGGLVSLRRKDGGAGGVEGAVARAEQMLAEGDLKGAVDTLDGLTPNLTETAKEVLGPWLTDARSRLTAERALATLHVRAISSLGEAG